MTTSSSTSRPSPPGGLRPAWTPTPGAVPKRRAGYGPQENHKIRSLRFQGIANLHPLTLSSYETLILSFCVDERADERDRAERPGLLSRHWVDQADAEYVEPGMLGGHDACDGEKMHHPEPISVRSDARRATVAASVGTTIEAYDVVVYGFFAVIIAGQFFPRGDPTAALLSTFAIYAVGFAVRPLGALVFAWRKMAGAARSPTR